jgi:16S rRNA (cytosine967-C5)-methyltransferase
MPKTSTTPNARRLALEIIGTWQRQNVPGGPAGPFLDDLIAKTLAEYPNLPRPDQGLLRELTTGVLRWRGRLDHCIGQAANKPIRQLHPLVLDLLRLTAYQLLFLDRIPPHAAVAESIKLAKKRRLPPALVAFVNAVTIYPSRTPSLSR